jgi:GntR family transcriptional regulator/MocR family aminotransferase
MPAPRHSPRLSRLGRRVAPLAPSWAPAKPAVAVDFRYGRPSVDDFPHETWRRVLARSAREASADDFDYGEPAGLPALREAVAEYLTRSRAVACTPEQIVIVHGSQQAIALASDVLLDAGDAVVIEEPGYPGATFNFWAAGAATMPGRVDGDGLDVAALARVKRRVRLVYVTPSHQFPTGVVMTLARRQALLAWAGRTGAWIVEDDYDSEFRFDARPVESLQGLDRHGSVLYMGTFSKVLFPALRVGYLVLPPSIVQPFRTAKALADTSTAGLEQRALARFMRDGHFARHLRHTRARNAERRAAIVAALAEHFGDRVEVLGGNAGLHVMLRFRDVAVAAESDVIARAERAGVRVYSVLPFYQDPTRRRAAELLLGYASLSLEQIRRGVARLARVLA